MKQKNDNNITDNVRNDRVRVVKRSAIQFPVTYLICLKNDIIGSIVEKSSFLLKIRKIYYY